MKRRITHAHGASVGEFNLGAGELDNFGLGENELVLAFLALTPEGINLLWLPALFLAPGGLTPELRTELVAKLRFHADRLESGDADARMRELCPPESEQS